MTHHDEVHDGILGLIGATPLVAARRLDTGPCELLIKLESQNPGGSIKDRIALSMIEAAERDGRLRPGGTLVEATAGNTGLGLALVAERKGYRLLLVIPDKMSREKILHLKALGAEVVMTRSDVGKGHPEYYQDLAQRLAEERGAFYVNQFGNPANALAHELTTGPELWRQTGGRLDAVVCGVGSSGTITGLSRYFARVAPVVELVLADPQGSVLAAAVEGRELPAAGSWLVEGIGEDFIPPLADLSRVTKAYTIGDEESLLTARRLLREEGILAGSSTGTLVAAGLRYCREQVQPKRVVTFACDSGNKCLSKAYNDCWMMDQGLMRDARHGDLRDLITRSPERGAVVRVSPEDTLMTAHSRMRHYDVSQLPVLQSQNIVGIIDESDLLLAVHADAAAFGQSVGQSMSSALETIPVSSTIAALLPIFERGMVAIVMDGERFAGLLTKIDLLNHLRNSLR